MRLSKVEVERRTASARKFFESNPSATVSQLNRAFRDGTLTGRVEPAMGLMGPSIRNEVRAAMMTPVIPERTVADSAEGAGQPLADAVIPATAANAPQGPDAAVVDAVTPAAA